ncbi:MAG: rod shape-determining protein MreC [Flavobacteriaceae bacterium]|nr:rod shape-determining protein MreC [Flavobacteriaceae bacterium]
MQQIIFFFIRNKNFLLFALLFLISVHLTIQTHSFHSNTYVSSANVVTGGVYSVRNDITDYFGLENENERLANENIRLHTQIERLRNATPVPPPDSSLLPTKFQFRGAKVINNTYSRSKNYLTLNKGISDGLKIDMGVIASNGIVGIVNNVSSRYATVQSILNTESQINVKLKKSNHFGSLVWNTKEPNTAQLIDVNRLAPVQFGDTIVTGGKSTIFPEGIMVGTIIDFKVGENDSYQIDVKLSNDMTSLDHVYIIENLDVTEIRSLEKEVYNAEQ